MCLPVAHGVAINDSKMMPQEESNIKIPPPSEPLNWFFNFSLRSVPSDWRPHVNAFEKENDTHGHHHHLHKQGFRPRSYTPTSKSWRAPSKNLTGGVNQRQAPHGNCVHWHIHGIFLRNDLTWLRQTNLYCWLRSNMRICTSVLLSSWCESGWIAFFFVNVPEHVFH